MNSAGTISLINRFLYETGIRIDSLQLQTVYRKHPMPHSIRIVSDVLDEFNVKNIVCRIGIEQLSDVPLPSIMFLKESKDLFYIFRGLEHNGDIMLETYNRQQITFDKKSLRNIWDGIILMAESDGSEMCAGKISYAIRQTLWLISRNVLPIIAALTVCLVLFFIFQPAFACHIRAVLSIYTLIGLVGAGVSAAAISKSHADSPSLKRICTVDGYDGCKKVIKSRGAIILGWISLGELSFTYFLCTTLWCISFPVHAALLMTVCGGISMAAVLYSAAWQILHREFCTLCAVIDSILVLSFCISLYEITHCQASSSGGLWNLTGFCICFALVLFVVKSVCEVISDSSSATRFRDRNERILAYPGLLWRLLESSHEVIDIKDVEGVNTISGIFPEYSHRLTIVLSPRCKYCAEFWDIFRKVEGYRKDIILLTDEADSRAENIAAGIIDITLKSPSDRWTAVCTALHDWYKNGTASDTGISDTARRTVKEHREFCRHYGISHTPAVFIDGKPLPDIYEAADIQYIL